MHHVYFLNKYKHQNFYTLPNMYRFPSSGGTLWDGQQEGLNIPLQQSPKVLLGDIWEPQPKLDIKVMEK